MNYCYLNTPIGRLLLAAADSTLSLIAFPQGKMQCNPAKDWTYNEAIFATPMQQLTEYFQGKRKIFTIKYVLEVTDFQQRVLLNVAKVPYGSTKSYSDIAAQLNNPQAVRAVGSANGRNPLPILIPCHRIIGKDGSLTGFGGGLETKRYLLDLEGVAYT